MIHKNAINPDVQKRCFALLLHAGYGERWRGALRRAIGNSEVKSLELWDVIAPTEANGYCMFSDELENDPLVFFHATPLRYQSSIAVNGFQSAAILGVGELQSVSYAKKSSACLAYLGCNVSEDYAVFAVRFQSLDRVVVNQSDIHVYDLSIQPQILGYCVLNAGFRVV